MRRPIVWIVIATLIPFLLGTAAILYLAAGRASTAPAAADMVFAAVVALAAIAVLAALALLTLLRPGVLHPLRRIAERVRALGNGDFSSPAKSTDGGALAGLDRALDEAARELDQRWTTLTEMAVRDGLTGLHNRLAFHDRLAEEVARARRHGRGFALLMLDIDEFKLVNDRFGHQTGDGVLFSVAAQIRSELRESDFAARYGGEEFAVILPETDSRGAEVIAERIRQAVGAAPFAIGDGREATVTISIGAATFPEDADDLSELIAAADRALYQAKHGGRNRVARFAPSGTDGD